MLRHQLSHLPVAKYFAAQRIGQQGQGVGPRAFGGPALSCTKCGSLILGKIIIKTVATRSHILISYSEAKMHQIRFSVEGPLQTSLEKLTALPQVAVASCIEMIEKPLL